MSARTEKGKHWFKFALLISGIVFGTSGLFAIRHPDVIEKLAQSFALFIISTIVFGGLAFALGWLTGGKYVSKGAASHADSLNIKQSYVEKRSFHEKFIKGDFGLTKTFWLFGFLAGYVVAIFFAAMQPSDMVTYAVSATWTTYLCVLLVAIWNAGCKYQGSKVWSVLALLFIFGAIINSLPTLL